MPHIIPWASCIINSSPFSRNWKLTIHLSGFSWRWIFQVFLILQMRCLWDEVLVGALGGKGMLAIHCLRRTPPTKRRNQLSMYAMMLQVFYRRIQPDFWWKRTGGMSWIESWKDHRAWSSWSLASSWCYKVAGLKTNGVDNLRNFGKVGHHQGFSHDSELSNMCSALPFFGQPKW
jgi:hypothetical protein